jgi:hypothetical protein
MVNLQDFLEQYKVSPVLTAFANPTKYGTYDERPAARLKELQGMNFSSLMLPSMTGDFQWRAHWKRLGSRFLGNVWKYWKARGWIRKNTVFWVWDEPGKPAEKRTIPKMNKMIHNRAPGVKVMMTGTPKQKIKRRRVCKWFGNKACKVVPGRPYTNKRLYNGGKDDVDIWAIPTHRHYGRYTSTLEKHHKYDNSKETYRLINRMRKRGKTIWTYSYYMDTAYIPQRSIDGHPADIDLLFTWVASENLKGWLLWDLARWVKAPARSKKTRDPYTDPLSWSKSGERSNGESSVLYPGYAPKYGLTDKNGPPVSSLRFENIRDGIEDVNLANQYRIRYGDKATKKRYRGVFGKVRTVPDGGVSWPKYNNKGMPQRLEILRRKMIVQMEK